MLIERRVESRDQLIAAPLKPDWRRRILEGKAESRDQLIAAPLKHLVATDYIGAPAVPRSIDRGPIEAAPSRSTPPWTR